jgi:Zn2+/Cd2+-exporting ATPase
MIDSMRHARRSPVQAPPAATAEDEELAALPWMIGLTVLTLVSLAAGWVIEEVSNLPASVPWALYVVAYLSGGYYSVQEAWESLKERQFDVNFLMIVAALGAAVVGQPREGAILMFLFSLSNTLETFAMGRTHSSIRALMNMTPTMARVVWTQDEETVEEEVPVEQVRVNQLVRVRPGEQIPADGVVVRGESAVNEASITGESMPVEKGAGARVFAGTINGQGRIDVRVTTAVENSTLARIVKIVSEAREQKARSQVFTDRVIGQKYAYAVVGMTVLAIIIPLVFLGWDVYTTVYRAMTLMVVASPCALVISIPAALLSALASAARNGVLLKGGAHLESASRVKVVAFDKTGTLTTGQPGVVGVIPLQGDLSTIPLPCIRGQDDEGPPPTNEGDALEDLNSDQTRLLAVAAAIENPSEHPLARAIVRGAQERGIVLPEAEQFEAMTGRGVQAKVFGRSLRVGRPSLFEPLPPDVAEAVAEQEHHGHSVVLVGNSQPWGLIAIADTVRAEAPNLIARIKQTGIERVVLLTGDNQRVAEKLGYDLGVDEVRAGLLPEDKVNVVRELEQTRGPVAMIGDGVNDAPALATATLGVAMGAAGTDVSLESADVLLMSDDLSRLPGLLQLARHSRRVVRQNLAFAFSVMAILVVLSLAGAVPLPLGVVGHEGSTLIVVANGLRLLLPWK